MQYILTLSLLLSFSSCSRTKIEQQSKPNGPVFTTTSENRKYNLTAVFHGDEVDPGTGEKFKVIRYLTLRDNNKGKEVKYVPLDEPSVASSQAYSQVSGRLTKN